MPTSTRALRVQKVAKTPITPADLQAHLDEQLGFLERSASSFDQGYEDEAKRLAVTLRVLLHETAHSHSLLGQLGPRNGPFVDTALPNDAANLMTHGELVFTAMGPPRTRYVAMLDDVPVTKQIPFEDWWNAPVFIDRDKSSLTRKQLVLIAANQDGGAHVDPALDDVYRKLSKENSLTWVAVEDGKARQMDGPERAAIRQIAHEVLKTLKPDYTKKPAHQAAVFVGGASLVEGVHPPVMASSKVSGGQKVGRNELCPCGSGKKYKKCCGSPIVTPT
jgi:SEC-C motif